MKVRLLKKLRKKWHKRLFIECEDIQVYKIYLRTKHSGVVKIYSLSSLESAKRYLIEERHDRILRDVLKMRIEIENKKLKKL